MIAAALGQVVESFLRHTRLTCEVINHSQLSAALAALNEPVHKWNEQQQTFYIPALANDPLVARQYLDLAEFISRAAP